MTSELSASSNWSKQSRTWHDLVNDCRAQPDQLSAWETEALASLAGWQGAPTRRQQARLDDIAEHLGVAPAP